MSFSSEQKNSIIEKACKSPCCRRAILTGVLFAKAYLKDADIELSIEKRDVCLYIVRLIREFYGTDAQITRDVSGGRRYLITFKSKSATDYIVSISDRENLFVAKCDGCAGAFLRGVFLASGRASDPKTAYSIHFSLGVRAEKFIECLNSLGLSPMLSGSGENSVVYFTNGSSIEDFYGTAGMNRAMFEIIDERMEAEIRKKAARVSNCEMNNIKKAIDAAGKQYDIILALEKANLLSSLPDDLESTARLRLLHKDMSLSQLAAISTPPISKPGLSHRLKKIMEIGEKLLHRNTNE